MKGLEKVEEKKQKASKDTKIIIAKAMLKQDMSIDMIVKLTGLSKKRGREARLRSPLPNRQIFLSFFFCIRRSQIFSQLLSFHLLFGLPSLEVLCR